MGIKWFSEKQGKNQKDSVTEYSNIPQFYNINLMLSYVDFLRYFNTIYEKVALIEMVRIESSSLRL